MDGDKVEHIVFEVPGKDLKDPMHESLIVSMEPECSRIICLKAIKDNFFKTDAMRKLLQEKQASIGREFAAIEVKQRIS